MRIIIGLGNPEAKYEKTRHNIGFRIIDTLRNKLSFEDWKLNKKLNCFISQEKNLILAKPTTFMNNSGLAVKLISDYFKINPQDILIIHDEIDLPFGEMKIQEGRGSAGHNGVQSIIDHLGTKDFLRLRIGIKNEQAVNLEQFVLENFSQEEEKQIETIIEKAIETISMALNS